MLGADSPAIEEKRVSFRLPPIIPTPPLSILTKDTGNNSPNHLWHRRPPSRSSLPLQIPPPPAEPSSLLLQPDMGQPQPNLLQRTHPHSNLPILFRSIKRPRL